MDKRKLKRRSNLLKNLGNLGSQISRNDSVSSTSSNLSEDILTRKRKIANSTLLEDEDSDSKTSQGQASSFELENCRISAIKKSNATPMSKKQCISIGLPKLDDSDSVDEEVPSPKKKLITKGNATKLLQGQDTENTEIRKSRSVMNSDRSPFKTPVTPSKISQLQLERSPLKRHTPVKIVKKNNINNQASKTVTEFTKFLQQCGVVFLQDDSIILKKHPVIVKQALKDVLFSSKVPKEQALELIKDYFRNDTNLVIALSDMEIEKGDSFTNSNRLCLVKLFLENSELQTEVSTLLLEKLNNSVLIANSLEEIPWARTLIQQYRFVDFSSDPDALFNSLEQLIESCPSWFLKELIIFLPDIISERSHCALTEILIKLLEENFDLVNSILNCVSSLTLGKEYLEEFKDKVMDFLKKDLDRNTIPSIVKFLLDDCQSVENAKKIFKIIRNLDLQPLAGEILNDCYVNQLHISNAIKLNILLSKDMVDAALAVVGSVEKDPKPIDIVILLHIFSIGTKKKNVEALMKRYIQSGFYRKSLFKVLYNDYREVARDLQPSAIHMASTLLKSTEAVYYEFAVEWFRCQFVNQADAVHKQREILERIILLMGNNDKTAKNALLILHRIAADEEERKLLQVHCNHLRILLEKMDNLDLEEVGTLCDLLHRLCADSGTISESLNDDLYVLFQKQLASAKPLIKSKGVLGAVMALKHLIQKEETIDKAKSLFKSALNCVKTCQRSKALFYDQLTQVIENTKDINNNFLSNIAENFEHEFINTYMIDITDSSLSKEMSPQFKINNEEEESNNGVVYFKSDKYGALVPITFKLLKTCYIRLSENGNLNAIDALLTAAILMPEDLDSTDSSAIDHIIHCINWFREIISGFAIQSDPLLQARVLKRIDHLMELQNRFCECFSFCSAIYQPPPCYFHYFPAPAFTRTDKAIKKKGKKGKAEKSADHEETHLWISGSRLCSKNPAYFRKLDPKVVGLLDIRMKPQTSQRTSLMSITQVCFLINELLGIFENEPSESFIRDLIELLPKVCSKLACIVSELRDEDDALNREAVRLLLMLISKIFSWKGFQSVTYNALLRDGLRTLAGQINESNAMLRSCKELVAESYKYIESLSDIATHISLAIALVTTCQSLMKHSDTYVQQFKGKQAKLAFGFLSLKWPEDRDTDPQYTAAIMGLLNNWIEYEPSPLNTINILLEWLPEAITTLEKPKDALEQLPSIGKKNFPLLYKKLFDGIIKGIKISLANSNSDPERLKTWQQVATCVQNIVHICKTLKNRSTLSLFLRKMPLLLNIFLQSGMPILEYNLKYQCNDITRILKIIQESTRYLHRICCDCSEKKDILLSKYVPAAKAVLEKLLYSVKGMLALNSSSNAFWMGNLVNKNLDGLEILSQASSENTTADVDVDVNVDDRLNLDDASSVSLDILQSDEEDSVSEA
ncbi:Fanconi anemia group D2 protein homolog [Prorops nasuta]|uniref:Fanconi anemia group D2 protein homolog n=1 Tax=Prorops nasuta TaxID=863751 RepID=UPI0034D0025E